MSSSTLPSLEVEKLNTGYWKYGVLAGIAGHLYTCKVIKVPFMKSISLKIKIRTFSIIRKYCINGTSF
jgi:hypothetical protein